MLDDRTTETIWALLGRSSFKDRSLLLGALVEAFFPVFLLLVFWTAADEKPDRTSRLPDTDKTLPLATPGGFAPLPEFSRPPPGEAPEILTGPDPPEPEGLEEPALTGPPASQEPADAWRIETVMAVILPFDVDPDHGRAVAGHHR